MSRRVRVRVTAEEWADRSFRARKLAELRRDAGERPGVEFELYLDGLKIGSFLNVSRAVAHWSTRAEDFMAEESK